MTHWRKVGREGIFFFFWRKQRGEGRAERSLAFLAATSETKIWELGEQDRARSIQKEREREKRGGISVRAKSL